MLKLLSRVKPSLKVLSFQHFHPVFRNTSLHCHLPHAQAAFEEPEDLSFFGSGLLTCLEAQSVSPPCMEASVSAAAWPISFRRSPRFESAGTIFGQAAVVLAESRCGLVPDQVGQLRPGNRIALTNSPSLFGENTYVMDTNMAVPPGCQCHPGRVFRRESLALRGPDPAFAVVDEGPRDATTAS
jgi:hypothetical protein